MKALRTSHSPRKVGRIMWSAIIEGKWKIFGKMCGNANHPRSSHHDPRTPGPASPPPPVRWATTASAASPSASNGSAAWLTYSRRTDAGSERRAEGGKGA